MSLGTPEQRVWQPCEISAADSGSGPLSNPGNKKERLMAYVLRTATVECVSTFNLGIRSLEFEPLKSPSPANLKEV